MEYMGVASGCGCKEVYIRAGATGQAGQAMA